MSNSAILKSAGDIEDMVVKTKGLVDHAEMYPDSGASFQEVRLVLNAIAQEAQHIMSLAKTPTIVEVDEAPFVSQPDEFWLKERLSIVSLEPSEG
jgi:hypothetical protein